MHRHINFRESISVKINYGGVITMRSIIYLIGLVVVVYLVLRFLNIV